MLREQSRTILGGIGDRVKEPRTLLIMLFFLRNLKGNGTQWLEQRFSHGGVRPPDGFVKPRLLDPPAVYDSVSLGQGLGTLLHANKSANAAAAA